MLSLLFVSFFLVVFVVGQTSNQVQYVIQEFWAFNSTCGTKPAMPPFRTIESPMNECLTQDGFKYYKWECEAPNDCSNYKQCVYADPKNSGRSATNDYSCVLESAAICQSASELKHQIDTCQTAYASIDGSSKELVSDVTFSLGDTSSTLTRQQNQKTFVRREYNTPDCTGDFGLVKVLPDVCTSNPALAGGIHILFENEYSVGQATNSAQYCLYYKENCKDAIDEHGQAVFPFACHEYNLNVCESDGVKSQIISLEAYTAPENPGTTAHDHGDHSHDNGATTLQQSFLAVALLLCLFFF